MLKSGYVPAILFQKNEGVHMGDLKKLGANIRSLRIAYGETQEQLGEAIYVEKNTVSYYENGKREPNKETLTAIANHFTIPRAIQSKTTFLCRMRFSPSASRRAHWLSTAT